MGDVLFRPFDLGKWFVLGFCAWLATLGENGLGGSYGNINQGFNKPGGQAPDFQGLMNQAKDFINSNFNWLLPVAIAGGLLILILSLVILWLNARGQFLLLNGVANNVAEVVEPWRRYAKQANQLFVFRLCIYLASAVVILPLMLVLGMFVYHGFTTGVWQFGATLAIGLLSGAVAMVVGVTTAIVLKLTKDFVVPIMYRTSCSPKEAWVKLWPLIKGRFESIIVYLLFSLLLLIASGILTLAVMVLTCCIACCLLAIPYIGTVLMLPVLVFFRSFSVMYLGQLAPEYDVFPEPSPLKFG